MSKTLTCTPMMQNAVRRATPLQQREVRDILDRLANMGRDECRRDLLTTANEWCLARHAPTAILRSHALMCLMDIAEYDDDRKLWGEIAKFVQDELPMDEHAIDPLVLFVKTAPLAWYVGFAKSCLARTRSSLRQEEQQQIAA